MLIKSQIIAASTIILGEIIVTLCGDHKDDEVLTIDLFNDIYRSPTMVGYFIGFGVYYALVVTGTRSQDKFVQKVSWGQAGGSITGE